MKYDCTEVTNLAFSKTVDAVLARNLTESTTVYITSKRLVYEDDIGTPLTLDEANGFVSARLP